MMNEEDSLNIYETLRVLVLLISSKGGEFLLLGEKNCPSLIGISPFGIFV